MLLVVREGHETRRGGEEGCSEYYMTVNRVGVLLQCIGRVLLCIILISSGRREEGFTPQLTHRLSFLFGVWVRESVDSVLSSQLLCSDQCKVHSSYSMLMVMILCCMSPFYCCCCKQCPSC